MSGRQVGLALIAAGALLALVGLLAWSGLLAWFGRLPGDVRIDRPGFRLYAPLGSMLLVSLVLSLLWSLLRRLL
jgi:Protein of unknown function (DUF2905)